MTHSIFFLLFVIVVAVVVIVIIGTLRRRPSPCGPPRHAPRHEEGFRHAFVDRMLREQRPPAADADDKKKDHNY